jgi:hypothetical protein
MYELREESLDDLLKIGLSAERARRSVEINARNNYCTAFKQSVFSLGNYLQLPLDVSPTERRPLQNQQMVETKSRRRKKSQGQEFMRTFKMY